MYVYFITTILQLYCLIHNILCIFRNAQELYRSYIGATFEADVDSCFVFYCVKKPSAFRLSLGTWLCRCYVGVAQNGINRGVIGE